MSEGKMKVVLCEPGKEAQIMEIGSSLAEMQRLVQGSIEAFYGFKGAVCIVCNEEGKINGSKPNRAVYGEDHKLLDIIFGTFFICDCSGEDFDSLSEEQLTRYKKLFQYPEHILYVNGKIEIIPYKV